LIGPWWDMSGGIDGMWDRCGSWNWRNKEFIWIEKMLCLCIHHWIGSWRHTARHSSHTIGLHFTTIGILWTWHHRRSRCVTCRARSLKQIFIWECRRWNMHLNTYTIGCRRWGWITADLGEILRGVNVEFTLKFVLLLVNLSYTFVILVDSLMVT